MEAFNHLLAVIASEEALGWLCRSVAGFGMFLGNARSRRCTIPPSWEPRQESLQAGAPSCRTATSGGRRLKSEGFIGRSGQNADLTEASDQKSAEDTPRARLLDGPHSCPTEFPEPRKRSSKRRRPIARTLVASSTLPELPSLLSLRGGLYRCWVPMLHTLSLSLCLSLSLPPSLPLSLSLSLSFARSPQ